MLIVNVCRLALHAPDGLYLIPQYTSYHTQYLCAPYKRHNTQRARSHLASLLNSLLLPLQLQLLSLLLVSLLLAALLLAITAACNRFCHHRCCYRSCLLWLSLLMPPLPLRSPDRRTTRLAHELGGRVLSRK